MREQADARRASVCLFEFSLRRTSATSPLSVLSLRRHISDKGFWIPLMSVWCGVTGPTKWKSLRLEGPKARGGLSEVS